MNQLAKNKKKKGFTLVELIAVMAILAILAAVIAPKAAAYIEKAKKTKVVQQCHTLVLAIDAYNTDAETQIPYENAPSGTTDTLGTSSNGNLKTLIAAGLLEEKDVDKISSTTELSLCRDIANNVNTTFVLDGDRLTTGLPAAD